MSWGDGFWVFLFGFYMAYFYGPGFLSSTLFLPLSVPFLLYLPLPLSVPPLPCPYPRPPSSCSCLFCWLVQVVLSTMSQHFSFPMSGPYPTQIPQRLYAVLPGPPGSQRTSHFPSA